MVEETIVLTGSQVNQLARSAVSGIMEFYKDPKHLEEFDVWQEFTKMKADNFREWREFKEWKKQKELTTNAK